MKHQFSDTEQQAAQNWSMRGEKKRKYVKLYECPKLMTEDSF